MEDLRYQHLYHPVPIEQKCPPLAFVLNQISAGVFGGDGVYEPYVAQCSQKGSSLTNAIAPAFSTPSVNRTTTSLRMISTLVRDLSKASGCSLSNSFYYSDIAALEMVDEAYLDKEEWIKKSIRTTAKVCLGQCGA